MNDEEEGTIKPQVRDESTTQMDIESEPVNSHSEVVKGELDLVGTTNLEPHEGMEFESEEAARTFYAAYARHVGFRIRISRYTRSRRDNSIISRLIVCSKEGFREARGGHGVFGEKKPPQRQRAVTRVGCKAMLMVKKLAPGKWVVSKFSKEHNHGPVPLRKVEARVVVQKEKEAEEENNGLEISNNLVDIVSDVHEPFEGMEFDSEEEAREFYVKYARQMGFRARISKYCRSRKDNLIISRQFVCSKEGFREVRVKKEEREDGRVKRPRVVTRIGCKAMIIVKKLNTGKWVVSRFEKEHNHGLVTSRKVAGAVESENGSSDKCLVSCVGELNVGNECGGRNQGSSQESLTVLYNRLCYEAVRYAQEGAVSEEIYNVAMSALKEAVEKVADAKKVSLGNELASMQQPFKFVLIPSTSLANNSKLTNKSIESLMTVNMLNEEGMTYPIPVSVLKQSLVNSESGERLVGNGGMENPDGVQNAQKLDHEALQVKITTGSGTNSISSVVSDADLVAIPPLPVTLYAPCESSSYVLLKPCTTPSSNSYTLVTASIATQSQVSLPPSSSPSTLEQNPQLYAGPNPEVHATAIAAGARIIPPHEAASLIKAIEARARSSKPGLMSGCKQFPSNENRTLQQCNNVDKVPQAFSLVNTLGECTEIEKEANSEEMRVDEGAEELKEMEVTLMDHSAIYDSACEDHHLLSDGDS